MREGDLKDRRTAAYELCSDAKRLDRGGDPGAAVAIYDDIVSRFGDSEDGYLQDLVAYALANRASVRATRPDLASGTEPTPHIVAMFERSEEAERRDRLARAIVSETVLLTRTERHEEAVALSKSLIAAVKESDTREVRTSAAMALQNVVEFLMGMGRGAEAEEALRDLAARFGEELLAEYDEAIAENGHADLATRLGLRYRRAELLRAMGRTDEALAAFTGVIAEFGDNSEVQSVIDRARDRQAALLEGVA
jgi:tetratricopeptide (TPR) repeat protein